MQQQPLDLAAIRARLAAESGPHYWRSLAELAETDEFQEFLRREFPRQASGWLGPVSRRTVLQMMAASLGLACLTACGQPSEKILPYVNQPPELVPGQPLFYATALTLGGVATGVLVESNMGRPTKIEGNPDHPASLGHTDALTQARILDLYDPDRSQTVLNAGEISRWESFLAALEPNLAGHRATGGRGLRLLTESVSSPTLLAQMATLQTTYPQARWYQYEPVNRDNVHAGSRLAFGTELNPVYRFENAAVVVSLDADFLQAMPGNVPYANHFIQRRDVTQGAHTMNRLYVIESTPTITGAMADHRRPLRAGQIEAVARSLAAALGVADVVSMPLPVDMPASWLAALVADLQRNRGTSLVLAGDNQPPVVHALCHAINETLGNIGHSVVLTDPVTRPAGQVADVRQLVAEMAAGQVTTLVIIDGNPVYTAPADLDFAAAMNKVPLRIHLGAYADETAFLCHWHLPAAHALESWSDARAFDGTISIMQPLIAPLYNGKSAHELLAALLGQPTLSAHGIVRQYWSTQHQGSDFDSWWQTTLHAGLIAGSTLPLRAVKVQATSYATTNPTGGSPDTGLEINFQPDRSVWDGRWNNNGWLQELPRPMTKLTWDNAALISPHTATRLGLQNEDEVELRLRGRTLRAPIWILPGQPQDAVTVHLGYGRTQVGKVGSGSGFDAYALRTSDSPWFSSGLEISRTGQHHALVTTQQHFNIEGRDLVQVATLADYQHNPSVIHKDEHPPSLYPAHPYPGYAWGMAINLNACIGCNACTMACQAENNSPIVGKEQVALGREMHWIRVDQYYEGNLDNPASYHQPVPCMHCENAPCEPVCPVEATVHDDEGLNTMVYNRCVGTRYCSNNCPYKVRRFNFLQYSDQNTISLRLERNPNVTIRQRGVMEKCTYCVQRISAGRIQAEKENRVLADGEVQTACQAVCPTNAIVFGNINDPNSAVAKLKAHPLNYGLLAELGTQPRTSYLARLRNPNPEMPTE